ncbi:hypothetical protein [Aquamicrobium ahrensii]|jgi:hypothetical protein|uniref:Uncharacterized protein n=1 Tax=Aquamicrobium ahrensii TaxID=469551 RepID=A0ABV2KMD8_9HYPH
MRDVHYHSLPSVMVKAADLGRNIRGAMADTVGRHVDFFHDGWKPRGLFLRLPFTSISMWLEWSPVSVGWGYAANPPRDREVYLGRVRGVVSVG